MVEPGLGVRDSGFGIRRSSFWRRVASTAIKCREGHCANCINFRDLCIVAKDTDKARAQLRNQSPGSHAECETQLELALRLKLADPERIQPVTTLATRVGQILHGFLRSLPKT